MCAAPGFGWKKAQNMQLACPHCREFDEALGALLVGELEVCDLEQAAQHLAYCTPCRTTLSELSQVTSGLRRSALQSPTLTALYAS